MYSIACKLFTYTCALFHDKLHIRM